jgi:hypothetical protein
MLPALLCADQKKSSPPPPPPRQSAPAARPATPQRTTPQQHVQPGVQQRVQPGVQQRVQPGVQQRVQPGVQQHVQPGVQQHVQPGVQQHGMTTQPVSLKDGRTANLSARPNGQIAHLQVRNKDGSVMTVNHPLRGTRQVVVNRNGQTIVANGAHGGYVQRPYLVRNGRTYVQRTYVVNNVTYTSVYRSYSYGGFCCYYGYVPAYYWAPAYYGWAYNPWVAPVYYSPALWGWAGAPWYAYYGFTPYPVYPSAAFWLTDYVMAANLQAAYAAQAEANQQAYAAGVAAGQAPANGAQPPDNGGGATAQNQPIQLTPEVKQMIAEEVKAQLAAEQAAAGNQAQPAPTSTQLPDALNPAERVFIASSNLDVTTNTGQACSLTPGDVVMRMTDQPDANQQVNASVQTSKGSDCATGTTVAVGVQDLQEMHNQFRQKMDAGLKTLADKSGSNGLPQAPTTATTPGEVPPPAADSNASAQLANALQDADVTEKAVQQSGS